MKNRIDRRSLLQLIALASASMVAGCGPDGETVKESDAGPDGGPDIAGKRVIVVGGGLSGLCSAHELRRKGYTIAAILEAQDRVGGRVLTLRDGLKNGQYAEAGATRIADSHALTLQYIKEFGLPLREFVSDKPPIYYLKGKPAFIHNDGDPWPTDVVNFPTTEEQMTKGADGVVLGYENLDELGDPLSADWPTGKALEYDSLKLSEYYIKQGANEDVNLLYNAINGTEGNRDSCLYLLMADVVDAKWDKTYTIAGGNDQLPKAFATALGDLVKLKSEVTSIAQDDKGVKVTYKDASGAEQTVEGDLCICAIPPPLLRKIKITPDLSAEKANVVEKLEMMPVSRCYLQTKTRFWDKKGIGNLKVARTDTYIERLWDLSLVQDGENGLLLSYMQSDNGVAFGMQPDDKKIEYVKSKVKEFFPEIDDEFEAGIFYVWQDDPWAGGAWGQYKPGEMASMFPAAKKSEGRLYFCGEHTSAWSGWMQGAIDSADRVVKEILKG